VCVLKRQKQTKKNLTDQNKPNAYGENDPIQMKKHHNFEDMDRLLKQAYCIYTYMGTHSPSLFPCLETGKSPKSKVKKIEVPIREIK